MIDVAGQSPLNILHVFRAPVGGLFRHVVVLALGQIARGHRVGLIADSTTGGAQAEGKLAELAPHLALGLTRIPMSRQIGPSDINAAANVTRRAADVGAHVIHGHGAKGVPSASTPRTAAACTIVGRRRPAFSTLRPNVR